MALYKPGIQQSTGWQWDQENPGKFVVSAIGGREYTSAKDLVYAVNQWLGANNISFTWHGELSKFEDNNVVYRYQVILTNESDMMLFNLRWAS